MPDNVVHLEQCDPILEPLGRYLQIWTDLYTLADVESAILARRDSSHHASGLSDEGELEAGEENGVEHRGHRSSVSRRSSRPIRPIGASLRKPLRWSTKRTLEGAASSRSEPRSRAH